jgi:hypothetical protein
MYSFVHVLRPQVTQVNRDTFSFPPLSSEVDELQIDCTPACQRCRCTARMFSGFQVRTRGKMAEAKYSTCKSNVERMIDALTGVTSKISHLALQR